VAERQCPNYCVRRRGDSNSAAAAHLTFVTHARAILTNSQQYFKLAIGMMVAATAPRVDREIYVFPSSQKRKQG
jgi:hypothetical protein